MGGTTRHHTTWTQRRRVAVGAAVILGLVALYEASVGVVAYTDDASVETDFVEVAPRVAGPIKAVLVRDNQRVAAGTPLATIDDTPYRLDVAQKEALLDQQQQRTAMLEQDVAAAQARLQSAQAAAADAQADVDRARKLLPTGTIAREAFDAASAKATESVAAVAESQALARAAQNQLAVHKAELQAAQAALDIARFNLSQTTLFAPVDGFVTNLTLRPGDYAAVGKPVLGLVDDHRWHVVANFREAYLPHLTEGQTVWMQLSAQSWRLFRGRVEGVGRGIARSPSPGGLLPYIDPAVNWIRLERRFPVHVTFEDLPADVRLHMGSDVRAVIVY